jgi:hypothetical protein
MVGDSGRPHLPHALTSGAAQFSQNFAPASFLCWHRGHCMPRSPEIRRSDRQWDSNTSGGWKAITATPRLYPGSGSQREPKKKEPLCRQRDEPGGQYGYSLSTRSRANVRGSDKSVDRSVDEDDVVDTQREGEGRDLVVAERS